MKTNSIEEIAVLEGGDKLFLVYLTNYIIKGDNDEILSIDTPFTFFEKAINKEEALKSLAKKINLPEDLFFD